MKQETGRYSGLNHQRKQHDFSRVGHLLQSCILSLQEANYASLVTMADTTTDSQTPLGTIMN